MEQEILIGLEPEMGTPPARYYRFNATNFTPGINQEIVEDEYLGGPHQTGEMTLEKTEGSPSFDLKLGAADPDLPEPVFAELMQGVFRNNWSGAAPRTANTIALVQEGSDWWLEDSSPWAGVDIGMDLTFTRSDTRYLLSCIGVAGNRLRVVGEGLQAQAAASSTVKTRNIRNGDEHFTFALSYRKGSVWYHYTRLTMGQTNVESQRRGLIGKFSFNGQLEMNTTGIAEGLISNAPDQVVRPDNGGGHWMSAGTWLQQFNFQIGAAGTPEYDLFEPGPIDVEYEKYQASGDITVRWRNGEHLLNAYGFVQNNVFMRCRPRSGAERPVMLWRFPTAKLHEPGTATSGNLRQETFKFTATGFDHDQRRHRNYLAQLAVI